MASYFEANEEGEGHGDEDKEPADDGQDPSAHADPRVAILSCKIPKEITEKNKVFGFIFSNWWRREKIGKDTNILPALDLRIEEPLWF